MQNNRQVTGPVVDVEDLIDRTAVTGGQWVVIAICCILSMIDGFDLQAIAFAAPEIRREWGVPAAALGPVFSAGLLGSVVGGFAIGPLSDRLGPRRLLIACPAVFGAATLCTALVNDLLSLGLLRVVAGFGLGATVPALVATISAFSPTRLKAVIVTAAICAQLLGAVFGSLASIALMQTFDWRSIFYLGGILPLVLLPFIIWRVPEPLTNLIGRGASAAELDNVLKLIGKVVDRESIALKPRLGGQRNSAVAIFQDGRALSTTLLLVTAMVGGAFYYFLANWLPTILRDGGLPLSAAVFGSTALNLGGLIGSLIFASLLHKKGVYSMMTIGYVLGATFVIAISLLPAPFYGLMGLIFATAFFGLGAQYCIPAAVVLLYPSHLRGAGTGFVLGFARLGAVIGPLVGTYILLAGGGARELFQFAGLCALGAAVAVFTARIQGGLGEGSANRS